MEEVSNTIHQLDLTDLYSTTPPNNSKIHILLKCTWDILQVIPHVNP